MIEYEVLKPTRAVENAFWPCRTGRVNGKLVFQQPSQFKIIKIIEQI